MSTLTAEHHAMLKQCEPVVRNAAGAAYRRLYPNVPFDDALASAWLGACLAVMSHKQQFKSLRGWIYIRAYGQVLDDARYVSKCNRSTKIARPKMYAVDWQEHSNKLSCKDAGLANLESHDECYAVLKNITPSARERYILWQLYVEGRTQSDVGNDLGVGQTRIAQIVAGIKRRLGVSQCIQ